jgi:hypothetical protein
MKANLYILRGLFVGAVWLALGGAAANAETALPPLPDYIKSQGELRVGVRCDQPPYGYLQSDGKFAGVEVEMARRRRHSVVSQPAASMPNCPRPPPWPRSPPSPRMVGFPAATP